VRGRTMGEKPPASTGTPVDETFHRRLAFHDWLAVVAAGDDQVSTSAAPRCSIGNRASLEFSRTVPTRARVPRGEAASACSWSPDSFLPFGLKRIILVRSCRSLIAAPRSPTQPIRSCQTQACAPTKWVHIAPLRGMPPSGGLDACWIGVGILAVALSALIKTEPQATTALAECYNAERLDSLQSLADQ
jgi:hypothetical protein